MLLKNDAQPPSDTNGATWWRAVVALGSSQRGVCVLPPFLQLHAKAVVANTCFISHVSWLNKDYIYYCIKVGIKD